MHKEADYCRRKAGYSLELVGPLLFKNVLALWWIMRAKAYNVSTKRSEQNQE